MNKTKTAVAALAAGAAVLVGGAAAALTLPEQASDTAVEKVAEVVTGREASGAKNAAGDAGDAGKANANAKAADAVSTDGTGVKNDDSTDAEGGERPTDTHGYEVSTLATTTDAEGSEKGEAISTVARTNGRAPEDAGAPDDAGAAGKAKAAAAKERRP
ncbi:MAG TPA: hypothetical protein VM345_04805 [Acidimicrobiales bacterium]|nr:hypothetical protein [Acidimicrobiales bacterium]